MAQHFLLSAAARTLSLASIYRQGEEAASGPMNSRCILIKRGYYSDAGRRINPCQIIPSAPSSTSNRRTAGTGSQ